MDYISASQLRTFLDPRAFAVSRTTARGATAIGETVSPIRTADANASLGLLLGAEQRLADFRTSLQSMLSLSIKGAQSFGSERKYDDAYGKLRSLTAGFDQVLDASTYGGQQIFDGRGWDLTANGQPVDIDGRDLRAAGENLGLVERSDGATVTVGYDPATVIRNSNSGLKGLDIADAVGIPREDGKAELENGKYRLEIEYNGPDSRLILSDEFGVKIEELKGVDLRGQGNDLIKFKAGIQLSIEKLDTSILYDKWDYEANGPVSLHADLNYERVSWHTLTGDNQNPNRSPEASWTYKPFKDTTEPALNIDEIAPNGIIEGHPELKEGDYQIRLKYRGDKSIVEIRDLNGMMMKRLDGVNLGPDSGTYTVDTGMGIKFTVENNGFGENEREMRATFKYKPVGESQRDFDFLAYGQRIVDAINVVDEQLSGVTSSIDRIKNQYNMAQGRVTNSALTILGSGGASVSGLLSGAKVGARLSVSSMQLFSSIAGGVQTQGSGATSIFSFLA